MPAFWRLDANRNPLVRRSKHFFNGLLREGSVLFHSMSGDGDGRCGDIVREVPLVGTFEWVDLVQLPQDIEARLDAIELASVDGAYRVTGEGVYAESVFVSVRIDLSIEVDGRRRAVAYQPDFFRNPFQFPEMRLALTSFAPCRDGEAFELLLFAGPREGAPFFRRGDVNGDRSRNLGDVVRILSYLFRETEAPSCLDAADVDDDGLIGLSDPIYLLSFLFRGGPRVPVPLAFCGLDAAGDELSCEGSDACA